MTKGQFIAVNYQDLYLSLTSKILGAWLAARPQMRKRISFNLGQNFNFESFGPQ